MSVSELLYSPLLNFVFENLNGVDEAVILRKGVDFFKDLETVKSEKAKLWSFVNENIPLSEGALMQFSVTCKIL